MACCLMAPCHYLSHCWLTINEILWHLFKDNSNNKVHGANMGPTWVLSAPDGPHVGPTNLVIREFLLQYSRYQSQSCVSNLHIWNQSHHPGHWGQPREATVVKMAPTRPLASRSFCLLAPLCDHRSLSNLQQSNTRAWYTLHQNDRLVPFLVFVQ